MATWPNVNNTDISTQNDEIIVYQNGINYVQNLGTFSAAVDQGQWVPTFDYEVNTVVRGSDGKRYISIQESGPNKGGDQDPTSTPLYWFDCTGIFKSRQATPQEVADGADVDAYVPPDLLKSKIQSSTTLTSVKTEYDKPTLEVSGSDLQASQDFSVVIDDEKVDISTGEVATLPTLSNATDYKVYAAADGTLSAQEYDTAAPANSTLIGGFHAAYSDASINPQSIWDFAWKPATGSPRAMALSLSERVWADIYLMDTDYGINGYSRPDAQIADGDNNLPKRPLVYGGDGRERYSRFTQYVAKELSAAAGKSLPDYDEFADIAYGTVTGQVAGSDPVTTKHQAGLRSAIGLEQATGAMWQWGRENWDRGNGSSGYSWYAADTDGSGQVYTSGSDGAGALAFGGNWISTGESGPRCANWFNKPWSSSDGNSARAVSKHTKYGA